MGPTGVLVVRLEAQDVSLDSNSTNCWDQRTAAVLEGDGLTFTASLKF
jgi:hypothetical protein